MPEQNPAVQSYTKQKPKESIFGGNLFLKIVFVLGIIIIIAVVVLSFLGKIEPTKIIFTIVGLLFGGGLIYLALVGLVSFFKPHPFSPTEDWRTKLIRICIKAKPFNVRNLWLRGEDMRTRAKWGKIIGLGFIPYISQIPKKDAESNIIYKKDAEGNLLFIEKMVGGTMEKHFIPEYDLITEKDGDVLLVLAKFPFPINLLKREVDLVRCGVKYISDLVGDIYIKDVNLVPYGEYLYPAKQWQSDIIRIMKQHEMEAVIMTHRQWLDLISNVTQMSLSSSPEFQKILMMGSERLASGVTNV